ncbi:MAG TPA: hypothetical protein VFK72_05735, partial [Nevskia sp.]|nr:hypothetical protein [Nevskia sp.]
NAFITVVVPAPDEPVTAMTGCLIDMAALLVAVDPGDAGRRSFFYRASERYSERLLNSGEM